MPRRKKQLPTLAVTGGTGFVGAHLIRIARQAGYPVRALTRKWQPPGRGLDWVEGTLDRPDPLRRLCEGSDAVIHIAGAINARDRAAFEAVNAGGTANMVDAARAAGVRRFVNISSLSAREPELSDYGWSKAKAERIVAASGLDWTTIRPPAVYGPGDRETLELFKMARRGLVLLPPGDGRLSVIHVEDLGRLILAVIDDDDSRGALYEPDDGAEGGWSHREFAQALGMAVGRNAKAVATPRPLLGTAAWLDKLFRGSKAKLTADRVRYFCHPDWVATAERRPRTALWQPQIATPGGLIATAAWYRGENWLR